MICPKCQYENTDDARFCRFCGAPLQEGVAEEDSDPNIESELCPNCGQENEPSAQYCASCGTPLGDGHGRDLPQYLTPTGQRPPPLPKGGFTDLVGLSFSVYREHFVPLFSIALIPQIPPLIVSLLALTVDGELRELRIVVALAAALIGVLASGAMVYGVSRHFLGRPVYVQQSLSYAWARYLPLVGVVLLVLLGLTIPVLLSVFVVGIPALVFLVIIWLFATHTVVIEQRGPVEALRRSWHIVRGSWWRVFGIVLGVILVLVGLVIMGGVVILVTEAISSPLATIVGVMLSTLITPLLTIAFTLLYFDLRVRKENYTHNDLANELGEQR